MENKEKQIEEMARDICRLSKIAQLMIEGLEDWSDIISKYLIEQGWVKIHKDSVILSKEEHINLCNDRIAFDEFARSISNIRLKNGNKIATFKDLQDHIKLQTEIERKETAEKIYKEVKPLVIMRNERYSNNNPIVDEMNKFYRKRFNDIFTPFGVEIKE